MSENFDYNKEPGKELNIIKFEKDYEPIISVVMPFYNDKDYIEQSVYSVLNQTFPCFEILIIDDGSTDEESLKKLEKIKKIDNRIKIFHKENEGLSATRDYGASKSSKQARYLFFLDSDDLIENTYFECAYWTLETNKEASWAYTDSVGFDADNYTWNKWFNSEIEKKQNDLVATAMIRKKDFFEVNGYELREKSVNEDWNFWLKMISKGKYPVRMNFYGFWYRRKKTGSELAKSKENKKRALEIINQTAKQIKKKVTAIQYPRYVYNWDKLIETIDDVQQVKRVKDDKINILMIIPWMTMGGADKFNLDLISRIDKDKFSITIVTTETNTSVYYQKFCEHATVYELTTFLDHKYWLAFINNIIEKNNINLIMNTNSETGYAMLPYLKAMYPEIPIIDYIHMEEWYNRNGGYSRDSSSVSSVIDKTLTCNENSKKILLNHFGRKEEEVETVYIGVDEEIFSPAGYDILNQRNKYGISKKYVIGYICRIAHQKRPFLLLEIIKELKKERDDFVFLIAGTGELLDAVKNKVKTLKLSDNVKFVGKINDAQGFYMACDLTLNCSIKEGLALTSYESIAMGIPVISSDVGGQSELINEDVGVIVPCMQKEEEIMNTNYSEEEIMLYVNGINKILDNLNDYKKRCRDRIISGFTINQMVDNMSKIFTDVHNNPNKEKIANGNALRGNKEITLELITKTYLEEKEKTEWQCSLYNKTYGLAETDATIELFKGKMWGKSWYRALVHVLQRTGIMKTLKKLK